MIFFENPLTKGFTDFSTTHSSAMLRSLWEIKTAGGGIPYGINGNGGEGGLAGESRIVILL